MLTDTFLTVLCSLRKELREAGNAEFSLADQKEFLHDLALISGVAVEDIVHIRFRSGCVIFEGSLDPEAAKFLAELFNRLRNTGELNGSEEEIVRQMVNLIKKYKITRIEDDPTYLISILRPRHQASQVIFIHGWNGNKVSFGELPDYIEHLVDCQALVFEYPTGIWKEDPDIYTIAQSLDNWIRNRLDTNRLALLAHSMGGLVARKLLVSQYIRSEIRLDHLVKAAIMIASPNQGTRLAELGARILPKDQLRMLSSNSGALVELNDQWKHWVSKNVPKNCRVRCIYGTKDRVITKNEATGVDRTAVPILNADHISIVKPKSPEDELVLTVKRFLEEANFPMGELRV